MITRFKMLIVTLVLTTCWACTTFPDDAVEPVTLYADGQWWNGSAFERGDRYVRGGMFVEAGPASEEIALDGAFVVPPLVDGHVHDFNAPQWARESPTAFLRDGIFTALEMGGATAELEEARAVLDGSPLDVRFAGISLTSPGGHPIPYIEAQALGLYWWGLSTEEQAEVRASRLLEGNSYFAPATLAELEQVWPRILATNPDHLKLILWGDNGLDPELAVAVTAMAHRDGLLVAAHVQHVEDADVALRAGVDLLAHLPDHNIVADLPHELVDRLAAAGIPVVPTMARELAMEPYAPPSARRAVAEVAALHVSHTARLRQLHASGVTLVPGADLGQLTALDELAYWQEIGAFSGAELMAIATAGLPAHWREGGEDWCLTAGCRVNMIVLGEDPSADILAYRRAIIRIREGQRLPDIPEG